MARSPHLARAVSYFVLPLFTIAMRPLPVCLERIAETTSVRDQNAMARIMALISVALP